MNQENNKNQIPDNDPSKAMDSRREVEQSNDNKTDQDFPGYPHYPAKEDIMDQRTDSHRVDLDVENIPSNRNFTGVSQRFKAEEGKNADPGEAAAFENDELVAKDGRNDEIGKPQNVTNEDLANENDIPGSSNEEGRER